MVSCIILSAGFSQRFGSPKALVLWQHQPLLEYLQHQLLQTDVSEIIIVLGAHHDTIRPYLLDNEKIKMVFNSQHVLGQTSSFKAGLRQVSSGATGIMLLPVDYPNIQIATFNLLIEAFLKHEPKIIIPTRKKRKGHPPIFHRRLKNEILSLPDSQGLNAIAQQHSEDVLFFSVQDKGIGETFNTPEEFEQLKNKKW